MVVLSVERMKVILSFGIYRVNILVESMIWRDRNLKFGPNYDLEEDNLEKKLKIWRGAA